MGDLSSGDGNVKTMEKKDKKEADSNLRRRRSERLGKKPGRSFNFGDDDDDGGGGGPEKPEADERFKRSGKKKSLKRKNVDIVTNVGDDADGVGAKSSSARRRSSSEEEEEEIVMVPTGKDLSIYI